MPVVSKRTPNRFANRENFDGDGLDDLATWAGDQVFL